MFSLVYLSSSVQPFTSLQLVELLTRARKKNAALEITGMLLYKDGNFMQLLEGEEPSVHHLYSIIWGDQRHRSVNILTEQNTETRLFPDWSMGFQNLENKEVASLPGYTPFLDAPLTPETFTDSNSALNLLRIFKTT